MATLQDNARISHRLQAFPCPLRPKRAGVAGPVCWNVSEENEVLFWSVEKGLASDEWKGLAETNQIISCALVLEPDQDVSKRARVEANDDGFILASDHQLFWRLPSTLASAGKSFDLMALDGLLEDETCTAIAGKVSLKKPLSVAFVGTSFGRILRLELRDATLVVNEVFSAPQADENAGLLSRLFTPRKPKLAHNLVVSICLVQNGGIVAAFRQGDIVLLDSDVPVPVMLHLPDRYMSLGHTVKLRDKGSFSILVIASANQSSGHCTLLECEIDGARDCHVLRKIQSEPLHRPVTLIHSVYATIFAGFDSSGEFRFSQEENLRLHEVADAGDRIIGIGTSEKQLLVIMESGQVASNLLLTNNGSGIKGVAIPQERIERLVRLMVTEALEKAAEDRKQHGAMSLDRVLPVLRAREEWNEIRSGNLEARQIAARYLAELVRSRLTRSPSPTSSAGAGAHPAFESKLNEKVDLVKISALGLAQELHLIDSATGDGEEHDLLAVSLQTTGEELFAAIECLSRDHQSIRAFFSSEEAFLASVDNVKILVGELQQTIRAGESDMGSQVERILMILDTVFVGAERFSGMCGAASSNLAKLLRPSIMACLNTASDYFQAHSSPRSALDLIKRVQALSLRALRAQHSKDALEPLLKLAAGVERKDKSLAEMALVAVKALSIETLQFITLIDACYLTTPEDSVILDQCLLRRTDPDWKEFPRILFQWLIGHGLSRKAFLFCENSEDINRQDLLGCLMRALQDANNVELSAVAKLSAKGYIDAARTFHSLTERTGLVDTPFASSSVYASLGFLCAFAGEESAEKRKLELHFFRERIKDMSVNCLVPRDELSDLMEAYLRTDISNPDARNFVWAQAVLVDIEAWKDTRNADLTWTLFVLLCRRLRKEPSLLPGKDFFDSLAMLVRLGANSNKQTESLRTLLLSWREK